MSLSENTTNRLYNWKFEQALVAAADQPEAPSDHERSVIESLAATFGNPGWFSGALAGVVQAAVHDLIGDVE